MPFPSETPGSPDLRNSLYSRGSTKIKLEGSPVAPDKPTKQNNTKKTLKIALSLKPLKAGQALPVKPKQGNYLHK